MSSNPVIQFRCAPDLRALLARYGADPGEQIREDEEVLAALVLHHERELAGRFTAAEAALIVDALNGHFFTPGLAASRCVLAEVEDAIRLNAADFSHAINGPALIAKLHNLSPIEDYILLILARQFRLTPTDNSADLIRRLFRVAD